MFVSSVLLDTNNRWGSAMHRHPKCRHSRQTTTGLGLLYQNVDHNNGVYMLHVHYVVCPW